MNTTLGEFNAQFPFTYQRAGHLFGPYTIHFTGLKPTQDSLVLGGQWLAWPSQDLPVKVRKAIADGCGYFVCPVGGSPAKYFPGQVFQVPTSITRERLEAEGGAVAISKLVWDARDDLLRYLKAEELI